MNSDSLWLIAGVNGSLLATVALLHDMGAHEGLVKIALGITLVVALPSGAALWSHLRHGNLRAEFQAQGQDAEARIIARYTQTRHPRYEEEFTEYRVTVEFEAAVPYGIPQRMQLNATISQELYEQLEGATTIAVRYLPRDPRHALLAGEEDLDALTGGASQDPVRK